ncbi:hypothetical protein AB0N09_12180 [Streptomyces erythrochromogenes]|uniref:hypothetical protein n=1 Tax=Streptomyces erythrochromogenes TaxID=285574 RepID=UPI00342DBCCE
MRVGRTYTSHLNLETKQHELLGMDLGEGVPRRALVMGLVLYLVWAGPLLLLFGFPSKVTFTFYFLPPLLTVVYGTQKNRAVDRRWNVTRWSIGARYLVLGHRPIISGGRRASTRGEWISRRARWSGRTELLLESPLGGLLERWLGAEEAVPAGTGAPIRLAARPRLYGPDAVARAHGRKALQHQEGKAS